MGKQVIAEDPDLENQALIYNSQGNVPYFYIFCSYFHRVTFLYKRLIKEKYNF